MNNSLIPRIQYAGGRQPRSIEIDYYYRRGFCDGVLEKLLKLPEEIRHLVYRELVWDKEVWRSNNRIDEGINLLQHPHHDRRSLFIDTTGVIIPPQFINNDNTWTVMQHELFESRTGVATVLQRKDYVHITQLVKALQKVKAPNKAPDMWVLVDFLRWFWKDTVVDLQKDSQFPLSDAEWDMPYSLASTLTPSHYHQIVNLSLSFNSAGVSGSAYHRYSRAFSRVCHFVSREMKLNYLSLWLDFLESDVDEILQNPSAEIWIEYLEEIRVKDRFDMKLAFRWNLPTAEELEDYEEELADGMFWGVDMDVVEDKAARLKKLLMPTSLSLGENTGAMGVLKDE